MPRRYLLGVLVATTAILGVGCGDKRVTTLRPAVFREICNRTNQPAEKEETTEPAALQGRVITAGMQLTVTVAEDPSLSRAYAVPPNCAVDFAAVGRISVCGLTAEELAGKIRAVLERDFFQKATVTVDTQSAYSPAAQGGGHGVVYVLGEIGRPGPVGLPDEGFTVTKLIVAVGGFSTFAKSDRVRIIRYCEDGRKYDTYVNVAKIMKQGLFENDVPLLPNDYIIVPQKMISLF